MRFVIAGNQNGGKSTVFNLLTGESRRSGNYPGVTVDIGEGEMRGGVTLYDLPGIYSLRAHSGEENVTTEALAAGDYDGILNVVDGTCLQRGLYLTLQLAATGIETVVAVSMADEVKRRGGVIDVERMRCMIGKNVIAVVGISCVTGEGIDELEAAIRSARPRPHVRADIEPSDAESLYRRVDEICRLCVNLPARKPQRLDDIFLGRFAPLAFLALAAIVFAVTFGVGGAASDCLTDLIGLLGGRVRALLTLWGVPPSVTALAADGVIGGVGAVLGFLPTVMLLWFFMAMLEDSGLMARAAVIADRPMRAVGLSGRCAAPLLFGFGCTVPAVMAARTVTDADGRGDRARLRTIMAAPFMSCGAKLPVYAMFARAFFRGYEIVAIGAMYALGIAAGAAALCFGRRGKPPALTLELPPYRMPRAASVLKKTLDRARGFLSRTFTVILLTSTAVWALSSFDIGFSYVADVGDSMLADAGRAIAPLLSPLGFGDWRAASALAAGIGAKESVMSVLTVLSGGIESMFTPASAASFCVFVLLYTPCAAALSTIAAEAGKGRAAATAVAHAALAWCASFIVYTVYRLF